MYERHGATHTRLYGLWKAMRQRCNPRNQHLPTRRLYAARGITVCADWCSSFTAFQTWALSNGYQSTLTLDRIDNSQGYSPANCRWVTNAVQQANRRPAAQWALPQRKIQWSEYPAIQRANSSGRTLTAIAADYEVSIATIHRIVNLPRRAEV